MVKKSGKRFRKRVYKRRGKFSRRRNKASTVINRQVAIVPDVYKTKLKYCELLPTTFQTDPLVTRRYVGNGLYDPLYETGGAQPRGFDQLMGMYNSYRVSGSAIRVVFISSTTSSASFGICGVYPNIDTSVGTTINAYVESPRCKWRPSSSANSSPHVITKYMSTKKALGLTGAEASDADYQGTDTANPAKAWYWDVFQGSMDGATGITAEVMVEITYYCTFFKRKDLAGS